MSDRYNIILMRDDAAVRRLRIGRGWINFFFISFFLIVFLTGSCLWAAFRSHENNSLLQNKLSETQKKLDSALNNLERLEKVEYKIDTEEVLSEKQSQKTEKKNTSPALTKTEENKKVPAVQPSQTPEAMEANGQSEPAENKKIPTGADIKTMLGSMTVGQISIENFRAVINNNRGLNLRYNLVNLKPQTEVSGQCNVHLLTKDGALHALELPVEMVDFHIQKFKEVNANSALPQNTTKKDALLLLVTVTDSSGQILFREPYVATTF